MGQFTQDIQKIGNRLSQADQLIEMKEEKRDSMTFDMETLKHDNIIIGEAITALTTVLSITQDEILRYIEELVTMALQYVYGEDYSFIIKFELKRNQPELSFAIMKDGYEQDPRTSMGGGILDVVSFALRIAVYSLIEPKPTPVIIADEAFKFISSINQMESVSQMVKEISNKYGLQIILISSKPAISDYADKVFEIYQEKGISYVKGENYDC